MKSGVYITWSLLLIAGCAHSNWQQAAVPSFVPGKVNAAAQQRAMTVEKILDDADIPAPTRPPVPLLRAQNSDNANPNVSLTSSSATKTPLITHDAATLALIEKETREFSKDDRERAVAALKAIPSESVPAVLQLWKAGLISPLASPTSPVVTAQAKASDFESSVQLASHTTGAPNAGLGQSSPWASQTKQLSGYTPQDNSVSVAADSPALPTAGRSQQINRISHQSVGFSSPFPDATDGPAMVASDAQQAPSRQLTIPPPWNPNGNQVTNPRTAMATAVPAVPADWATATAPTAAKPSPADWSTVAGATSPRLARNGQHSSPFGETSPRTMVKPPEWQNTASTPPRVVAADRSASPVITPQAAPLLAATPFRAERAVADQLDTGVEQTRFNAAPTVPPGGEIPLAPGQAMPGFEDSVPRVPRRLPPERAISQGSPRWDAPKSAPAVQTANEALQFLIKATESEVASLAPGETATELQYYIERQVYLRLLYLMNGQTEGALRPIPNVPPADQEFWTQVLWGVHNYFDTPQIPDHAERAAQTISQFNTAMLRLKERAPLELKNATFCNKIDGYGEYSTYQKNEFTPGERVLIYAEIGNFHSELSAEGIYRTRLKSTLEVYCSDASGEPVETKTYPVTEDFCRNHRRDYFHSYVVEIPARCARGSHVLKLIIEDELSGKVGTYSVPFTVR
ncbi:MAG: hypothetical protein V4719_08520 [Planctomycetota bacterium]